jgi:hypothetical protein
MLSETRLLAVVSLMPSPQHGGPGDTFCLAPTFALIAVILTGADAPASINLQVIRAHQISHHVKVIAKGGGWNNWESRGVSEYAAVVFCKADAYKPETCVVKGVKIMKRLS